MKTTPVLRALALVLTLTSTALHAQVPQIINYQGRVAVGTTNFDGSGAFKFALVNAAGSVTYWSNDGTSAAGSQPAAAVTLPVTKGLYSVLLGDTTLGASMTAIPHSVFANSDVRLRVWFNDGTAGSQLLTPDQRLAAVGYAMVAGGLPNVTVSAGNVGIGTTTPGAKLEVIGAGFGFPAISGVTQSAGLTARFRPGDNAALDLGGNSVSGFWLQSTNKNDLSLNYPLVLNPNGGNVGIGTNGPSTKLQVAGTVTATSFSGLGSALTGITSASLAAGSVTSTQIAAGAVGSTQIAAGAVTTTQLAPGAVTAANVASDVGLWSVNGADVFRSVGNVGIGTTLPGAKLEVIGAGFGFPATSGVTQSAGLTARFRPGDNAALDLGGNSVSGFWLQSTNKNDLSLNYPLVLNPNGGNVGIGTTGPSTKLQVAGTVTATAFSGPLTGNASTATTATNFTGILAGNVTGPQGTTVVASVGGVTAADVATGANLANAATTANTPNTLVKRDASGNIPGVTPASTAPPGMALIPAGTFTMGDNLDGLSDAVPIKTTISAFYMDVNLVSLSQWQGVKTYADANGYTFTNAGAGKGATHPVQTVNWYDCVKWCNARSQQAGRTPAYYTDAGLTTVYKTGEPGTVYVDWVVSGYRLPTEAEWEKAARGGRSNQRFPWGNTISHSQANYYGATGYAYDLSPINNYHPTYATGGNPYTSPVGSFAANGYGLNDMAGNVFQWCWDWYGTPYAGGSDPYGPASGSFRVLRGGNWGNYANYARCAYRNDRLPVNAFTERGFRAVLAPGQ